MAYTLTNGASTKVVDSDIQKDELVRQGWAVSSGSAHVSSLPFNEEDKVTNPTLGAFKGVGRTGEAYGSVGEAAIAATEGANQATYEVLMGIAHKYGNAAPDGTTYTSVEIKTSTLGTADATAYAAKKIYVLTAYDATNSKAPGVYVVERDGTSGSYTYSWAEYSA